MKKDALGNRMKSYEAADDKRLSALTPIMARLDGRCFSAFTRDMARPYDDYLAEAMVETTRYLVEHTGALMGYTQSDEITLVWYTDNMKSQIWFDGRVAKMTSQLSAQATLFFFKHLQTSMPSYLNDKMPTFDARVFSVPTLEEAANNFLWREKDATKNSITMAASTMFSHYELMDKTSNDKLDMLYQKGINWNKYPSFFKRGTFVQRRSIIDKLSKEELEALPELHDARKNPDLEFARQRVLNCDMPPFSKVLNRVDVIFKAHTPLTSVETFNEVKQFVLE